MTKFYSDIELETLIDNAAEAIISRDVKEWPRWIVVLTEQINKKGEIEPAWIRELLGSLERAHGLSYK